MPSAKKPASTKVLDLFGDTPQSLRSPKTFLSQVEETTRRSNGSKGNSKRSTSLHSAITTASPPQPPMSTPTSDRSRDRKRHEKQKRRMPVGRSSVVKGDQKNENTLTDKSPRNDVVDGYLEKTRIRENLKGMSMDDHKEYLERMLTEVTGSKEGHTEKIIEHEDGEDWVPPTSKKKYSKESKRRGDWDEISELENAKRNMSAMQESMFRSNQLDCPVKDLRETPRHTSARHLFSRDEQNRNATKNQRRSRSQDRRTSSRSTDDISQLTANSQIESSGSRSRSRDRRRRTSRRHKTETSNGNDYDEDRYKQERASSTEQRRQRRGESRSRNLEYSKSTPQEATHHDLYHSTSEKRDNEYNTRKRDQRRGVRSSSVTRPQRVCDLSSSKFRSHDLEYSKSMSQEAAQHNLYGASKQRSDEHDIRGNNERRGTRSSSVPRPERARSKSRDRKNKSRRTESKGTRKYRDSQVLNGAESYSDNDPTTERYRTREQQKFKHKSPKRSEQYLSPSLHQQKQRSGGDSRRPTSSPSNEVDYPNYKSPSKASRKLDHRSSDSSSRSPQKIRSSRNVYQSRSRSASRPSRADKKRTPLGVPIDVGLIDDDSASNQYNRYVSSPKDRKRDRQSRPRSRSVNSKERRSDKRYARDLDRHTSHSSDSPKRTSGSSPRTKSRGLSTVDPRKGLRSTKSVGDNMNKKNQVRRSDRLSASPRRSHDSPKRDDTRLKLRRGGRKHDLIGPSSSHSMNSLDEDSEVFINDRKLRQKEKGRKSELRSSRHREREKYFNEGDNRTGRDDLVRSEHKLTSRSESFDDGNGDTSKERRSIDKEEFSSVQRLTKDGGKKKVSQRRQRALDKAAILIQRWIRKALFTMRLHRAKVEAQAKAALTSRGTLRGFRVYLENRIEKDSEFAVQATKAAKSIQGMIRAYQARSGLQRVLEKLRQVRASSTITIQRVVRGYLAKLAADKAKYLKKIELERDIAIYKPYAIQYAVYIARQREEVEAQALYKKEIHAIECNLKTIEEKHERELQKIVDGIEVQKKVWADVIKKRVDKEREERMNENQQENDAEELEALDPSLSIEEHKAVFEEENAMMLDYIEKTQRKIDAKKVEAKELENANTEVESMFHELNDFAKKKNIEKKELASQQVMMKSMLIPKALKKCEAASKDSVSEIRTRILCRRNMYRIMEALQNSDEGETELLESVRSMINESEEELGKTLLDGENLKELLLGDINALVEIESAELDKMGSIPTTASSAQSAWGAMTKGIFNNVGKKKKFSIEDLKSGFATDSE